MSWPTIRGVGLIAHEVGVDHVDAEALHEALVALDVDRGLEGGVIDRRDLRAGDRVRTQVPCRPLADELAGQAVVRGERGMRRVRRVELGVEGDDEHAGFLGLLDRGHDALRVGRRQEQALGAGRDEVLDGRDLALVVGAVLAGERLDLDVAELRRPWPGRP